MHFIQCFEPPEVFVSKKLKIQNLLIGGVGSPDLRPLNQARV